MAVLYCAIEQLCEEHGTPISSQMLMETLTEGWSHNRKQYVREILRIMKKRGYVDLSKKNIPRKENKATRLNIVNIRKRL